VSRIARGALLALAVLLTAPAAAGAALVVGHSVRGHPITMVRVGAAVATERVLVVGCIHGSERAGLPVVRALHHVTPPPGVQLLLVDALNPDGCARGTRGNADGVDLNRNFPTTWRPLGGVYAAGPRAASEPETRAAMRLIRRERPQVAIWFHQHMDLVDPTRGADPAIPARYAAVAGMRVHELAPLPGTVARWQNTTLPGSSAFVVELPAGRLARAGVRRHVAAVLAAARMIALAVGPVSGGPAVGGMPAGV
jgi:protein MpaA